MATRAPAAVATDEPLLTYLDDATGERTELTGPQLGGGRPVVPGCCATGAGCAPVTGWRCCCRRTGVPRRC